MDAKLEVTSPAPSGGEWRVLAQLLAGQPFAVLATQGDGAPYTSLVCFAASPDLRWLLFPTRAGTRKYANLEASPQVALLVDNRSNQPGDLRDAVAVTAIGTARLEHGEQERALVEQLRAKHPDLAGFLSQPDCRIAAVQVTEYRLVSRFEQVTRLDPRRRPAAP